MSGWLVNAIFDCTASRMHAFLVGIGGPLYGVFSDEHKQMPTTFCNRVL